jgi:superfamily I DNA/RNA helicase
MSLAQLNTEQQKAVEAGDGPVLIVAGPGTGKTKTLAARIAYLIEHKRVSPGEILALTFTNKAAREMQERVSRLLAKNSSPVISTFHGLAYKLLADTLEGAQLVTERERVDMLRSVKKRQGMKQATVRELSLLVSRAKNQLQPPDDAAIMAAVEAYNAELISRKRYDFDDLLLRLYELLNSDSPRPYYAHILVDEFQDTNSLQYEVLKLLNTIDNLFVIGDPLQSIYGFRGASAAIFDRFKTDWPQTTEITLATNYRSTPQVVRAAGAIFPDAPALHAFRTQQGKVCAVEVLNEFAEAEWIVNEIERQVGGSDMQRSSQHHAADQQRTFRDFAVAYRTHAVAKTVQRTLESSGIPYQVAGEGSPYLQPHIVAVTDSLAYIAGTGDAPSVTGYKPSQIEALLSPLKADADVSLPVLVEQVIDRLGIDREKHATSLRQFTNSLVPFEGKPLAIYLEHLRVIAEQEYYDPAADAITLLTIHASKGLEFSRVFIIGAEEGILPHSRPGDPAPDNDEERRLFYVAATRARDELYLLHTRTRAGERRTVSSFVSGLPAAAAERVIDPALATQQRKLQRRQQKRAQGSLF